MVTQEKQQWFYADTAHQKQGPFPPREFKALAEQGIIRATTPVWSHGYKDWLPAAKVEGLVPAIDPTPVPPAPTPPPLPTPASPSPSAETQPPESISSDRSAPLSPPLVEHLRPRMGAFLYPRIAPLVILFAALGGGMAALMGAVGASPLLGLLVFFPGVGFACFAALVAYRKERYELHDTRLLHHCGGLMSDQTTELEIRNITHVKVKLPWLRYKLFRIGDVLVESAGSSEAMVMRSVHNPESVCIGVRDRMQKNGYDLTQRELIHEEQPAFIGVVVECLGLAFVTLMVIALGFPTILGFAENLQLIGATWALWLGGALAAVAGLTSLVAHFLDLRRRTYRVYNDVVVYEEGFLTRQNAFIPYENITDAATKRSFIDQILNLYDVLVSCQGSSAEIKFRRLRGGVALSNAIDHLVVQARQKSSLPSLAAEPTEQSATDRKLPRRVEPKLINPGEPWVADLKMHAGRALVPLMFLLPIFPLWLAAMIQVGIKILSTRYTVRPESIRHSYRFLTTHDREFACDKITGLVLKENPWDRLFGTVTLRFWSIGSGQPLDLAHVPRKSLNLEALMGQIGIPPSSFSEAPYSAEASFGVLTWLRARLGLLPLLVLLATGFGLGAWQLGEVFYWFLGALALALGGLAGLRYASIYYSRQRLHFHPHHVEAQQGVLIRRRYSVRYANIKKIQLTRYPGGKEGALQIFVAGEQQGGNDAGNKKGQARTGKPCSFTSGLLPAIMNQGQIVDDILCGRVDPSPEVTAAEPLELICEAPRALGNTILKLVLVSMLVFPLLVLLPLTIPAAVIAVKRWRYRLEAGRVVMSWGLLYRKQASILLDRVDSLRQQQGPFNKLFKNGNVSIMTAGSSKPDLVMVDAPDFRDLYNEIRTLSQHS